MTLSRQLSRGHFFLLLALGHRTLCGAGHLARDSKPRATQGKPPEGDCRFGTRGGKVKGLGELSGAMMVA